MKTESLTPQQMEAMDLHDGCVVAGAGAGKTRTLVAKVLHDQHHPNPDHQIEPRDQIIVTFTNAAALEVESRLIASGAAKPRHIGTLHSLAVRAIMAAWGGKLNVLTDTKFDALIRATCKRTKINVPVATVRGWILERPKQGNGRLLVQALLAGMKAERLMHPDVMLAVFYELTKSRPETRNVRLYVDEAQDGSSLDFAIYQNLAKSGKNKGSQIFFGDPRQAIYAFRGANPEIFIRAIGDYGDGIVNLTTNFRSGLSIIEEANRIGEMMNLPLIDPMTPPENWETTGQVVRASRFTSTEMEAMKLVETIRQALDFQRSVAILTRYNAVADAAAAMLRSEGIALERPGQELPKDPALERLRNLHPEDLPGKSGAGWERRLMELGVPFSYHETLAKQLSGVQDVLEIGPIIDEAIGLPTDSRKVWLSTIHGAKGLEWDEVFLIGADNLSLDQNDPEDVRLAYVAVTRARQAFTVSWALHRSSAGGHVGDLKPSAIFFPPVP